MRVLLLELIIFISWSCSIPASTARIITDKSTLENVNARPPLPPLRPNHTSPHQPLDADWQADCLIPNTRAALVYKYGPEAPRWALAYTISGAKYDIRMKTFYHYSVEDPYFFEPQSHERGYLNVASYAGYPKHLTWELILDTITAVGKCTLGRGVNRTVSFHVAFGWGRVAMGELMYLPSEVTGVDNS